jgi:hypothetical protein
MERVLRVNDRLSLPEILAPLAPEALSLQWSVLDLGEVVPGEGWDRRVPFREPRVLESPRGWALTFAELVAFGEWTVQVIDGVFVACASPEDLPSRSDDDLTILERADMVVAAVDSTFWYVSAAEEVVDRAASAFHEFTEVDPGAVSLSTWGRDYGAEGPMLLPLQIDVEPHP